MAKRTRQQSIQERRLHAVNKEQAKVDRLQQLLGTYQLFNQSYVPAVEMAALRQSIYDFLELEIEATDTDPFAAKPMPDLEGPSDGLEANDPALD